MYMVVACPHCKQFQLTSAYKTLTCKYCGKSTAISKLTIYHSSSRHSEALDTLYRMKKEV